MSYIPDDPKRAAGEFKREVEEEMARLIRKGTLPENAEDQAKQIVSQKRKGYWG